MTLRFCFCDSSHQPTHTRGDEGCEHRTDPDEVLVRETDYWLRLEGVTQPAAAALLRRWLKKENHVTE